MSAEEKHNTSIDDWKNKKKSEQEMLYKLLDDTSTLIIKDCEKFKAFLDTQARLNKYSTSNALLIFAQYPQATKLKDFADWTEDKVNIIKGSKSISILEPSEYAKNDGTIGINYNIKKVFDISQTKGKQIPAPTVNDDPKELIATMIDSAPINVEISEELPLPNMTVFFDNSKQTLFVKRNITSSVILCQSIAQELAQELAHAQLSINSGNYSRKNVGFNAVCIGYMICKHYGVDTSNFNIKSIPNEWIEKSPKDIRMELNKSRSAMNDIITHITEELQKQKQARSKSKER